jgi:hypothetical protein
MQLLRILILKNDLSECVASKAFSFRDMKQFAVESEVLLHEGFWDLLYGMYERKFILYIVS